MELVWGACYPSLPKDIAEIHAPLRCDILRSSQKWYDEHSQIIASEFRNILHDTFDNLPYQFILPMSVVRRTICIDPIRAAGDSARSKIPHLPGVLYKMNVIHVAPRVPRHIPTSFASVVCGNSDLLQWLKVKSNR